MLMTALRTSVSTSRLNPRADGVSGNSRFARADMDLYIVIDPAVCCRCAAAHRRRAASRLLRHGMSQAPIIEEMIMGLLSIHIDVCPKADMRDIYSKHDIDLCHRLNIIMVLI